MELLTLLHYTCDKSETPAAFTSSLLLFGHESALLFHLQPLSSFSSSSIDAYFTNWNKHQILSKKAVVIDSKTAAHMFLWDYSLVLYLASDRLCAAEGKQRISWLAKLYCMLYGFLLGQLLV